MLAVPEGAPAGLRATAPLTDAGPQPRKPAAARRRPLPARPGAGCLPHGRCAGEKSGFRATSLETLRQMVAANVGHHPAAGAGGEAAGRAGAAHAAAAFRDPAAEPSHRDGLASQFGDGRVPDRSLAVGACANCRPELLVHRRLRPETTAHAGPFEIQTRAPDRPRASPSPAPPPRYPRAIRGGIDLRPCRPARSLDMDDRSTPGEHRHRDVTGTRGGRTS